MGEGSGLDERGTREKAQGSTVCIDQQVRDARATCHLRGTVESEYRRRGEIPCNLLSRLATHAHHNSRAVERTREEQVNGRAVCYTL